MKPLLFKGHRVETFTLRNAGIEAVVTNFGARLVALRVPDRKGSLTDVVMGFDNLEDYFPENHLSDFGAVIGRYANRLAQGRITVDGTVYQLPQNNGPNCLHGGPDGWQYKAFEVLHADNTSVSLSLLSPDGDNGFPGEVRASVRYSIDLDGALRIEYGASCNRPTVLNMTNHSYFNLGGTDRQPSTVHDHCLCIDADSFLPVDDTMIPLGHLQPVADTPMDLRTARRVGEGLDSGYEAVVKAGGYDHCWVLNAGGNLALRAASLHCPATGIAMDLFTTQPGLQLYTGNFLDGVRGKKGFAYNRHTAICLETQQFPDAPNHCWPQSSGRLSPDQPFQSTTIFKFYIS